MNFKAFALGLSLALVLGGPAQAQRHDRGSGDWELLGEESVGFGADRDVIRIRHDEKFYRDKAFRRLRFVARGGEVKMRSIRISYLNGYSEAVDVDRTLRPGQDVTVDLKGDRSYLRQIEMFYKSKFGISIGGGGIQLKQAAIQVFGEQARRDRPPVREPERLVTPRGWDVLARERITGRDDRVVFRIGRDDGRFASLRLQVGGDQLRISDVEVRFGNGDRQRIRVNQSLEEGQTTGAFDLDGRQRFIQTVTVNLERRHGRGSWRDQAQLVLLGSDRGDRRDNDRDLVPLGEVRVGHRTDVDVVRVGRSEDWFRNRAFDQLRLMASGGDVELLSISIVYMNGYSEKIGVDQRIREGAGVTVDLKGSRSYIREIQLVNRKARGERGRAEVKVFGVPAQRNFHRR
ncbi:MAG: hypothetical protein ACK5JT_06115 [Hyphomicrobiaceae bacterium]